MVPPAPHFPRAAIDPRPYCWVRIDPERPTVFLRSLYGDGWVPVLSATPSCLQAGRPGSGLVPSYLVAPQRLRPRRMLRVHRALTDDRDDRAATLARMQQGFSIPADCVAEVRRSLGPTIAPPFSALPQGR